MTESLNPTLLERVSRGLRPDFARTVLARRIAAGFLVVLAGIAGLRPDPGDTMRDVAVAVRDLSPGLPLTANDIRLETRSAATLPDGSATDLSITGAILAGPVRRGEILTDARVLGPRLAGLHAGPGARVVPLRLADAAVLDLIRTGDIVDVVGAAGADEDARPRVVAANAVVVLVSAKPESIGAGNDRVVMVALPGPAAQALAAATLVQTVTLTIH
ncbi:MAG: SAF domain-containing protein [Mycobacterium sp.]|nr:SAF domain-containing protein [Mycobacterium sp.]